MATPTTMASTFALPVDPRRTVTCLLFNEVQNMEALRQLAFSNALPLTLVQPSNIVDLLQVLCAVNRAVHRQITGTMKTRSLPTEILYLLSPTSHITDALRRFGAQTADTSVLTLLVDASTDQVEQLRSSVQGVEELDLSRIAQTTDLDAVAAVYGISPTERAGGSLVDSIMSRIAAKHI